MLRAVHVAEKAETFEVPAGHVVVIMPASKADLGDQRITSKGKKAMRPFKGFGWGTHPVENNPKIRVSASAILVNPEDYKDEPKTSGKLLTL